MTGAAFAPIWSGGQVSYGISCSLGSPMAAEIAGAEGYDYVCVDLQHGASDTSGLLPILRAIDASGSALALVRVLRLDTGYIGKVLDAGARGVVIPMVNTAEEAADAVASCLYPPDGVRSYGPFRAGIRPNQDRMPGDMNTSAMCFPMIETALGLAQLDRICSTSGLTGVYVGPSDLALSMGGNPLSKGLTSIVAPALGRIAEVCRDVGLIAGIHARTMEDAEHYVELGYRMVTLGTDAAVLRIALASRMAEARRLTSGPER